MLHIYRNHRASTSQSVFACMNQDCKLQFESQKALDEHIRAIHPPICNHCDTQFRSYLLLHQHYKTHERSLIDRREFKCNNIDCTAAFTLH